MTGKLLFDIGANIGAYAQARWDSGEFDKVVCIDANQTAFEKLRARFENNTHVFPIFAAASDQDNQKITFYETNSSVLSTANKDWITKPGYRFEGSTMAEVVNEVEVSTTSIDKLISFFGTPDLLKIDVEGFEETVIKGLSKTVPLLCFEWAREMSVECERTVQYLKELGFDEFSVQYGDDYIFYPASYQDINLFNTSLLTDEKINWGMVWVRSRTEKNNAEKKEPQAEPKQSAVYPFERNGKATFNQGFLMDSRNEKIFSFHLKDMGITRLLDIGSNTGQFVKRIRSYGYEEYVYSVEPQSRAHRKLLHNAQQDPKWTVLLKQGVGDKKSTLDINISDNSYSSSFLAVHDNHVKAAPEAQSHKQESVQVNKTSSIAQSHVLETVDAMKIDVQGFEKHVIDGYLEHMPNIRLLLVELSIIKCYEDCPDMFELDQYIVQELGFKRISLEPAYYDDTTGVVQQYDGIYYKPESKKNELSFIDNIGVVTSIGGTQVRTCTEGSDISDVWKSRCLKSWKAASNKVISISEQKPYDPSITWMETAERPSLNDMFKAMLETDLEHFILTNADIFLTPHFVKSIPKLDKNTIYYANRSDVEIIRKSDIAYTTRIKNFYNLGFDLFLLSREFVSFVIENKIWDDNFKVGEPWWDYLLPVTAHCYGFPTKKLLFRPTACMHITHKSNWNDNLLEENRQRYIANLKSILNDEKCIANLHLEELMGEILLNNDSYDDSQTDISNNTLEFLHSTGSHL